MWLRLLFWIYAIGYWLLAWLCGFAAIRAFTLYTLHSTLYALRSTLYTLHSTLYTQVSSLGTAAPLG